MTTYPLTGYGLMAKRHWTEFCPQMVKELEAKGTLREALYEAQETTLDEMEVLTRKLETEQKQTPQQRIGACHRARRHGVRRRRWSRLRRVHRCDTSR